MKWNNGKERAKFEREQKELREQYIAAGMTEEQIQEMYDFDLDVFNGKRREAEHTQTLDFAAVEAEDKELQNPLYKKFSDKLLDNSQANRHKKEKESRQKSRWNVAECITTDVHQLLCKAKNFCSNWLGVSKPR